MSNSFKEKIIMFFMKHYKQLFTVISMAIVTFLTNVLSSWLGNFICFLLCIICISFIYMLYNYYDKEKKRIKVVAWTKSNALVDRYKGFISFVSAPPRNKEGKAWFEEAKIAIDNALESSDYSAVTDLQSIGQTLKAIHHHLPKLKECWLLHSDDSIMNVEIIKYFLRRHINSFYEPNLILINNPNDSDEMKSKIDAIFDKLPDGLKASDVIADITVGNKPMTAAMILSCMSGRNIEYVEQSPEKKIIMIEIDPKYKFDLID